MVVLSPLQKNFVAFVVFEFIQKKGETGSLNFWQPIYMVPIPVPFWKNNEFKRLI